MGIKKDRSRFTIKFNENDPVHRTVIDILEQQGARQKAQFIAKAVLYYMHCLEKLDNHIQTQADRAVLEEIVFKILDKKENNDSDIISKKSISNMGKVKIDDSKKMYPQKQEQDIVDEKMKTIISHTLSMFRSTEKTI